MSSSGSMGSRGASWRERMLAQHPGGERYLLWRSLAGVIAILLAFLVSALLIYLADADVVEAFKALWLLGFRKKYLRPFWHLSPVLNFAAFVSAPVGENIGGVRFVVFFTRYFPCRPVVADYG